MKQIKSTPLKTLSLFSGIGGWEVAMGILDRQAGNAQFNSSQFVELDPFCQQVLSKRFPGVPIHGDISTYSARDGEFDCIVGSPPCQPFSAAGQQKGEEDSRHLWPEYMRIVREVRPKYLAMENVPTLLSSGNGEVFSGILRDLAEAGFDAEWAIISCQDLGGAHIRQRLWLIAYASRERRQQDAHRPHGNETADEGWREEENYISASYGESVGVGRSPDPNGTNGKAQSPECGQHIGARQADKSSSYSWPIADSLGEGSWGWQGTKETELPRAKSRGAKANWEDLFESRLCGGDARVPSRMDRPRLLKRFELPSVMKYISRSSRGSNHRKRLKALGNTVVPQCAAIPLARILEIHHA